MSRNRLKNSQSLHWIGVVKWILIAGLLAGLGLCYMLCKNQNLHLAEETHKLEIRLNEIKARNSQLTLDLDTMKSPAMLKQRLVEMNSTLVPWGDPRANWVRLDQNTRARLARMGTTPRPTLNLGLAPSTADATISP
jgi:hypothetical protein